MKRCYMLIVLLLAGYLLTSSKYFFREPLPYFTDGLIDSWEEAIFSNDLLNLQEYSLYSRSNPLDMVTYRNVSWNSVFRPLIIRIEFNKRKNTGTIQCKAIIDEKLMSRTIRLTKKESIETYAFIESKNLWNIVSPLEPPNPPMDGGINLQEIRQGDKYHFIYQHGTSRTESAIATYLKDLCEKYHIFP